MVAAAVRATFTDEADHQKTTSPSVDQWSAEAFFERFAAPALTDEAVERAAKEFVMLLNADTRPKECARRILLAAFPSKGG
ncbi:hypothetical protein [uncultured Nitratireductor sp.]|uniref:hypothetical protein n=1 Tax=uncultured Nitratireductor sp. TaxID=520953 RepID=UPI00260A8933|nr:hypothetical protein [uncultured Nitratireductor sp.]